MTVLNGVKTTKELMRQVERVMEEFGVEEWQFERCGQWFTKHPSVTFVLGGKTHHFMLAGSPSDRRAALNTRTQLRRLCRLHGGDKAIQ